MILILKKGNIMKIRYMLKKTNQRKNYKTEYRSKFKSCFNFPALERAYKVLGRDW